MYIINAIADDETKIGLYEIYLISHYFDGFICQRLYYDAEIA
jgi:hypothetical protein